MNDETKKLQHRIDELEAQLAHANGLLKNISQNLPSVDNSRELNVTWKGIVWSAFIANRMIINYFSSLDSEANHDVS